MPTNNELKNIVPVKRNDWPDVDETPVTSKVIDNSVVTETVTPSRVKANDLPTPEPVYAPTSGILTAEDMANLGIDTSKGVEIDYEEEVRAAEDRKYQEMKQDTDNMLLGMLDDVEAAQEEHIARTDAVLNSVNSDAEREEILGHPIARNITEVSTTSEQRSHDRMTSTNPDDDYETLVPNYDDKDFDKKVDEANGVAEDDEQKKVSEMSSSDYDAYKEFILGLEVATPVEVEKPAITRIKDLTYNTVSSGRNKRIGSLADDAFDNAMSRYKKDTFGKVRVPLINSGFMADMTGTGVTDLQNLYLNVDRNTPQQDYEVEQMGVVIQSVSSTTPKVRSDSLRNVTHYADFQMMAYGMVAATLKTIEVATNCPECGAPFRQTTPTTNLLINNDKITEMREKIENSASIEENSLMTTNIEYHCEDGGILIVLGHESYAEHIANVRGYNRYISNMRSADARKFQNDADVLYMIRRAVLPNGITSTNIYQHYRVLQMLSQYDREEISRIVSKMREKVIVPQFGLKEAICPHCNRKISDITYSNMLELIFYHASITAVLNESQKNS